MIEKRNWLTITRPCIAGFTAFNRGHERGEGPVVPTLVGISAFTGLIAVWYALYQVIEFPLWMAWFN